MAATFELEISTPEKLVVKEQVSEAQIPATGGYVGVLPGHAPMLSELGIGELNYTVGNEKHSLVISGGVLEVLPEMVRVLTTSAERASEIDVARAQSAMKRANERLASPKDNMDVARALNAMRRAQARLDAAGGKR